MSKGDRNLAGMSAEDRRAYMELMTEERLKTNTTYEIDGLKVVGLKDKSVTVLDLPYGVVEIAERAFEGNTAITEINLPSSVSKIGMLAFKDCTSLKKLVQEDSFMNQLGYNTFVGCTSLCEVDMKVGGFIVDYTVSPFADCPIERATVTSFMIKKVKNPSLKTLIIRKDGGFFNSAKSNKILTSGSITDMPSLMRIFIPKAITEIEDGAIDNLPSLNGIYYEGSVSDWIAIKKGENPLLRQVPIYYDCKSLDDASSSEAQSKDTFLDKERLDELMKTFVYTVQDEEHYVIDGLVKGAKRRKTLPIPEGVVKIGPSAFINQHAVASIELPTTLTEIGAQAFYGCDKVASVSFNEGLLSIGDEAFEACSTVKELYLPEGLERIGARAFKACVELRRIYIPDSVTEIGEGAFMNCRSLEQVVLPAGVANIPNDCFNGCTFLSSITVPDSVVAIGVGAFRNCTHIKQINISDIKAWLNIKDFTADLCDGGGTLTVNGETVEELIIPEGVTEIYDYALRGINSIKRITLPDSLTYCSYHAFEKCWIEEVRVKDLQSYCSISFNSRESNPALCLNYTKLLINGEEPKALTLTDKITRVPAYAFSGMGITELVLSESLTEIGEYAFEDCKLLTHITIPKNTALNKIGMYAFGGCLAFKEIRFLGTKKEWKKALKAMGKEVKAALLANKRKVVFQEK